MCNDISLFEILEMPTKGHRVSVVTGKSADVVGTGSIIYTTTMRRTTSTVRLTGVLCVPMLVWDLISVSWMRKAKLKTTFDSVHNGGGMCHVTTRDGKVEYLHGSNKVLLDYSKRC